MKMPIVRNANSGNATAGRTHRAGPYDKAQIFTNFIRTAEPRSDALRAPLLQVPAEHGAHIALHAAKEEHNGS